MKFQIVTKPLYQGFGLMSAHTHISICVVPEWLSMTGYETMYGNSEDDAKAKMIQYLQNALNASIGGGTLVEVDLIPNKLGKELK